jgi:hypothetical protein
MNDLHNKKINDLFKIPTEINTENIVTKCPECGSKTTQEELYPIAFCVKDCGWCEVYQTKKIRDKLRQWAITKVKFLLKEFDLHLGVARDVYEDGSDRIIAYGNDLTPIRWKAAGICEFLVRYFEISESELT